MLFYDSEFGTPQSYFDSFGIDTSRVLHTPITDVEQLKFDIMHQFEEIKRGDRVIVVIDSVGNLASKKEVEDALKQNSAADMTRAKQLKSLFRMVTPHLNLKDIPMIVVNHTYQTQEMYSKAVVSGGTGIYYSADNIFIIGRQQEKDGKDVTGYNFIINVEKSRFVKEKSKIPIEVSWDKGISKWSGLMDMALESGHVIKPKVGWYQKVDMETGEILDKSYRMADTYDFGFWHPILQCAKFNEYIEKKYAVAAGSIMQAEDVIEDLILDEDD
jgi:RecA/RadA recombinase